MNRAAILWILVVLGYVGFEVSAVRHSQHLFEPLFTFDQFASIQHATQRCGGPDEEQRRRFLSNLPAVRRRAGQELAERDPQRSVEEIERMLDGRTGAREAEVDALIEERGCADSEVWKLLKLYEIRARARVR